VGSDDSTSTRKRLTEPNRVPPELPKIDITVTTAAEATIAMAVIATLVATDMHFFPVAAVAIVPAPVEADAPIETAAWTAID
jgi:hypothetical protein